MEFDELREHWAAQKQDDMYTINQQALRERISNKKRGADRFSDLVEKVLIAINFIVGGGLLLMSLLYGKEEPAIYLIAGSILLLGTYVVYVRLQRLRAAGTFDRSLSGDLDQAISDTRHRMRISRMSLLYVPVVAVITLYHLWSEDKPAWIIGLAAIFFLLTLWVGNWEHRNWHAGRLRELERMREELNTTDQA